MLPYLECWAGRAGKGLLAVHRSNVVASGREQRWAPGTIPLGLVAPLSQEVGLRGRGSTAGGRGEHSWWCWGLAGAAWLLRWVAGPGWLSSYSAVNTGSVCLPLDARVSSPALHVENVHS